MLFPTEIIHLIIDHLVGPDATRDSEELDSTIKQDLRSCLRVNKDFYTRSRYHLFSTVILRVNDDKIGYNARQRTAQLRDILLGQYGEKSSHIQPLVNYVSRFEINYLVSQATFIPPDWEIDGRQRLRDMLNSTALLDILDKLSSDNHKLEEFGFMLEGDPFEGEEHIHRTDEINIGWDEFGTEFTRHLTYLCQKKIERVVLWNVTRFPMQILHASGIKDVSLSQASIVPCPGGCIDDETDDGEPRLRLETLEIEGVEVVGDAEHLVSALFLHGQSSPMTTTIPALQNLEALYITSSSVHECLGLMGDIICESPQVDIIKLYGLELEILLTQAPVVPFRFPVAKPPEHFTLSGVITDIYDPASDHPPYLRLYRLEQILQGLPSGLKELDLELKIRHDTIPNAMGVVVNILQPEARNMWDVIVAILEEKFSKTRLDLQFVIRETGLGEQERASCNDYLLTLFGPTCLLNDNYTLGITYG